MGFWYFMLIMDLLIPATMIIFGKVFKKSAPKEINSLYGYRTTMSMQSRETWEFAHKMIGKIWYVCGWLMVLPTIVAMFFVLGYDEDVIGTVGGIICFIQMVPLLGGIIPVEIALRKTFDKNGNRRNG